MQTAVLLSHRALSPEGCHVCWCKASQCQAVSQPQRALVWQPLRQGVLIQAHQDLRVDHLILASTAEEHGGAHARSMYTQTEIIENT